MISHMRASIYCMDKLRKETANARLHVYITWC